MARLVAGRFTSQTFVITDATVREYPFTFPYDLAEDVFVRIGDSLINEVRYEVQRDPAGTGGRIRFRNSSEIGNPVALAVDDSIEIFRDTGIDRQAEYPSSGYALGAAVESDMSTIYQAVEEMAAREGISEERALELIRAAGTGTGGTGGPGLTDDQLQDLRRSVSATDDGIAVDERTLEFQGADAVTRREIRTPGIWVEDEGNLVSNRGRPDDVDKLNFTGAGVSVTRNADTALVNIPGGTGGGATNQQIDARIDANAKVEKADQFVDDLEQTLTLVDGVNITQAVSNDLEWFSGNPVFPADTIGADLIVDVRDNDQGIDFATETFDFSEVWTKQGTRATQASASNSYQWSDQGTQLSIARDSNANRILFAADTAATYTVTIKLRRPDVENFARLTSNARVGAAKLGGGSRDGTKFLRDDEMWETLPAATTAAQGTVELATASEMTAGTANKIPDAAVVKTYVDAQPSGGLNQTAVDARVRALVADPAEQGNADRWTPAKLGSGTADATKVLYGDGAWKDAPSGGGITTFTDHQKAVFSAFQGTDHWNDSTTILINGLTATRPSASDLTSIPNNQWMASEVAGARIANVYYGIRVPIDEVTKVTANRLELELEESEGDAYPSIPASRWGEPVTTNASYAFYAVVVPDYASGVTFKVREFIPLDLEGGRIDVAQWNRTLGHSGVTVFTELYPGITGTSSGSDVEPSTALALSPTFDLDTAANQRGEFHLSLELTLTQANAQASFVQNQANPTADDKQFTGSNVVFASDLLEESVWGVGATRNGLSIFRVPVYIANTVQGTLHVLLVRDSNNQVAIHRYWDGAAGNYTFTISAELRATFSPTDAAAATTADTAIDLELRGDTWAITRDFPTGATAYTTNFTPPLITNIRWDATAEGTTAGARTYTWTDSRLEIPSRAPTATDGVWAIVDRKDGDADWTEVAEAFLPWGPGGVTHDAADAQSSYSKAILTVDRNAAATGRTAAIIGISYAIHESSGAPLIYLSDEGGPRPRATISSRAQRWRMRVVPATLSTGDGIRGPKGDKGDKGDPGTGGAPTILDADFTPSMTAASLGSVSNTSSPRTLSAPSPNTVGIAADGSLPAGITVASNVITFANAGRVVLDGGFIVQARDTAANNNNSRSRVVLWAEKAASTGNFESINGAVSTSEYIRVSYDYWNHGAGYTYLHAHAEFQVAAGDRVRLRIAALFNQASTITHGVVSANPDSNLLPGSGLHITHTA